MADSFTTFKNKLVLTNGVGEAQEHAMLLKHVKGLIDISRKEMSKHYSTWDYHDQVFRSTRAMDKEDRSANAKGQPSKLIVPLTYSQIMSFVAFCTATVTQNKRFFELEYEGNKPAALKEVMELILERDCRRNQWNAFLIQFFLDLARFWMGCAEVCYTEEFRNIRIPQEETVEGVFGVSSVKTSMEFQKIPVFVGNRVYAVSPYRWFPDTRLPLTRYQEGEFCGSEDMFSMATLRSIEDDLFNLDQIPKMSDIEYKDRRKNSRIDVMDFMPTRSQSGGDGESRDPESMVRTGAVVVTKLVLDIVPKYFKIQDKNVLGTEPFPIRYLCWFANDKTIIRFEEAQYLHGQFPYIHAQYLPDMHKTVNEGLSSVCDQITNLITWKLNAHLTSQRSSLDSKWVVDPGIIDIKSLESRSPYIFMKKNASLQGVERGIKQFVTTDVTAGVMADIGNLKELLENITGISSQMQGQYSQGRRSATQDRVVAQGAAARARNTLSGVWDQAFEPLGRQFMANNRQEMTFEQFVKIVGDQNDPMKPTNEELFALFQATPADIAAEESFFTFDGTQPSEKAFLAQSLQEILMALMQNPEIMQVLGYGPEQIRFLFDEIYELRGVTPPSLPAPTPQPGAQNVIPGPGAQPAGSAPALPPASLPNG